MFRLRCQPVFPLPRLLLETILFEKLLHSSKESSHALISKSRKPNDSGSSQNVKEFAVTGLASGGDLFFFRKDETLPLRVHKSNLDALAILRVPGSGIFGEISWIRRREQGPTDNKAHEPVFAEGKLQQILQTKADSRISGGNNAGPIGTQYREVFVLALPL